MKFPYEEFDLDGVKTYPLASRQSKKALEGPPATEPDVQAESMAPSEPPGSQTPASVGGGARSEKTAPTSARADS